VTDDRLTNQTVDLLQQMIRNRCVNDGTRDSGEEIRNSDLLTTFLEGTGLDLQHYDAGPGRRSVVARIEGSDPSAPTLCLMGHTDVVPVNEAQWRHDPFSGDLIDGEIWGRGAVDMLCLTSSMAVAFRELANTGFRPRGTLIYFGVADEEAGGVYGADWVTSHHWDDVASDYVLTETGGILAETPAGPRVVLTAAEKGIGWRRLTVKGTPGHGSMPWASDNALVKAAEIVRRFHAYQPTPQINEYWTAFVESMGLDEDSRQALLDPGRVRDAIVQMDPQTAKYAHACTHTTFSPNVISGGQKANMIPDTVHLEVDIRTLPGETEQDIDAHLRAALGDLYDGVDVAPIAPRDASSSPRDTPVWDVLEKRLGVVHPGAEVIPWLLVGGTDASFFRGKGAVAYGAGVFSERATFQQIQNRYHGDDERIDVESLALQAQLWLDVARDVVG